MTRKGPVLTLLGGGALAVTLLVASGYVAGGQPEPDPALAGGAAPALTPSQPPTPTPTPAPTELVEPEPVTYVGWVDGDTATVALIVTGEEAIGYVCDGVAVEAWLTGTARDGEVRLEADNATLTARYDADAAEGETTTEGQDWTFTIAQVDAPEGLYRIADTVASGAEVDGGWIVLPDGTQVGLLTVDGRTTPAPAIDPRTGALRLGGETVTVDRVGAGAR